MVHKDLPKHYLPDNVTPKNSWLSTISVLVQVLWSRQFRAVHAFAWDILLNQRGGTGCNFTAAFVCPQE